MSNKYDAPVEAVTKLISAMDIAAAAGTILEVTPFLDGLGPADLEYLAGQAAARACELTRTGLARPGFGVLVLAGVGKGAIGSLVKAAVSRARVDLGGPVQPERCGSVYRAGCVGKWVCARPLGHEGACITEDGESFEYPRTRRIGQGTIDGPVKIEGRIDRAGDYPTIAEAREIMDGHAGQAMRVEGLDSSAASAVWVAALRAEADRQDILAATERSGDIASSIRAAGFKHASQVIRDWLAEWECGELPEPPASGARIVWVVGDCKDIQPIWSTGDADWETHEIDSVDDDIVDATDMPDGISIWEGHAPTDEDSSPPVGKFRRPTAVELSAIIEGRPPWVTK